MTIPAIIGSTEQGGTSDNAFSLARMVAKYITGSDPNGKGRPVGRNFDFVSNNSGWMTAVRVYGDNMYISNRGNSNAPTALTSNNILIHKVAITSTDGDPGLNQLNLGTTDTSIDGFDLDPTGTKLIVAVFHGGGGARSGTLATGFDLTSTYSATGSKRASSAIGARGVSWGNGGKKYYIVNGDDVADGVVRQYTTQTNYVVASDDTEGTSATLSGLDKAADITFNRNGTKMFIAQHSGYLHEYALSTPWDSSTGTLTTTMDIRGFFGLEGVSPARAKTDTTATPWVCGMHWNEDGTKLYINSLWGMTDTFSVQGRPGPTEVTGSNDSETGTESGRANTFAVIEMSIDPVPAIATYDLSLMTSPATVATGGDGPTELLLSPYQILLALDAASETVEAYDYETGDALPGTPWSADDSMDTDATPSVMVNPRALCWGNDGQYIYQGHQYGGGQIVRRTLKVAYDINTVQNYSRTSTSTSFGVQGIHFKPDGGTFFIAGADNNIYTCTPNSTWDTSTFTYSGIDITVDTDGEGDTVGGITGIRFNADGTRMFVSYRNGTSDSETSTASHSKIVQYNLSTPWDVSTRSLVATKNLFSDLGYESFTPPAPPTNPLPSGVSALVAGFDWSEDGTELIVASVHEDDLSGERRIVKYTEE